MSATVPSPFAGLAGRRVLVTGADGFIGRALVAFASARDAHVTGIGRHAADIADAGAVDRVFLAAKPEVVVHAAGLMDWRQDLELLPSMLRVHVLGTANVLQASRRVGVRRVVCFGSAGEYGAAKPPLVEDGAAEPLDPYSTSKLAATELARLFHRSFALDTTVVRPFNVYGLGEPERRLFPSVFARARSGGGEIACTPGEQQRDFVHIDDVAEGAWRAALSPNTPGAILNLGTGRAMRVRDAVDHAVRISGGNVSPRYGALPYRSGEPMILVASTDKCRSLLGWKPSISLEDGLARTFNASSPI